LQCSVFPPGTPRSKTVGALERGIPQTIVAYGTSLTAAGPWVGQLRSVLSNNYPGAATLINCGASGMNSRWGIDNIRDIVLALHPDCVFIEFAINDVVPSSEISLEQSRINLDRMIDSIRTENPDAEIILMTMNPRTTDSALQNRLCDYYTLYKTVTQARNCVYIDNYTRWTYLLETDRARYCSYVPDGCHPTAEGCEKIVIPNIESALGIDNFK
jgi:lysophospholipase L1-like esterase